MSDITGHQTKWDHRFLQLAALVSSWSKDPSTRVGAVIVDPLNRVVSLGYNGFARGVEDRLELLEHRETKLKGTLHAEDNAILFARRDLTGCTIYTYPLPPCGTCASRIRQVGITRVVAMVENNEERAHRWTDDLKFASTQVYGDDIELAVYPVDNERVLTQLQEAMTVLSENERLQVMHGYCCSCGNAEPCRCWDDS